MQRAASSVDGRTAIDFAVDAALGATLLGWAVAGLLKGRVDSLVGLTLVAVNVVVGGLFLLRRPVRRRAAPREVALCLPSVLMGPAAMLVAPAIEGWTAPAQLLFVAAALALLVSLATLGGSFAVLPALRGVVARGPYRLLRHPVYAAELLMVVAAAGLAARSLWGVGVIVTTLVTLAVRIGVEERVLMDDDAYRAYQSRVRWRLVPLLW